MSYREFRPAAPWSDIIECVWVKDAAPVALAHTVLPDGAMDLIATVHPDGDIEDVLLVGAMTKPLRTTVQPRALVGVRFLPGAAGASIGTHAAEWCDRTVPMLEAERHSTAVTDAMRVLGRSPSDGGTLRTLSEALRMTERTVPRTVQFATHLMASRPAALRIEQVASELGVSRQQLARLFASHVGLTPKQFARVCRVRSLLARVRFDFRGWSNAAAVFGYSDQSHLIADVKAVTGQTPAEWITEAGSNFPIAPVASLRP